MRPSDSKITIAYDRGRFHGRIRAESGRCEGVRKVVVKKVKRGKDPVVERDRSNRRGRWSARMPNARGRFYSKVLRKFVAGNGNTTIRCNADRSRTIRP